MSSISPSKQSAIAWAQILCLAVASCLLAGSACAPECNGLEVNGECQPVCLEELCPEEHHCFENTCRAPCDITGDCKVGESCRRVRTEFGFEGRLCVSDSPPEMTTRTTTSSPGKSCAANEDCDPDFGVVCIDGRCTVTCEVHEQCGATGSCTGAASDAAGRQVSVCEPDGFPRGDGQYGTRCIGGDECDEDSDFVCISAGRGDIDAYCTRRDCAGDSDCPAGFFCSRQRSGRPPCNDVCDFPGRDARDCVEDFEIGAGRRYECGPVTLELNVCLLRAFCNSCDSDVDCRGRPNQICARDRSGEKICTVLCDPGVNSCPWGSAAVCGLWDEELGRETCSHRFGSCTGDGSSCTPCVDQRDCPRGFCQQTQFSRERYCVDLDASCACPDGAAATCVDGGCPLTPEPALQPMTCFGGALFEGTTIFQKCVGAATDRSSAGQPDSCWPSF